LLVGGAIGCHTPPVPAEVDQVKSQENDLWRTGAPVYAADEYSAYLESLRLARDKLIREKAKFGWRRDYEEVRAAYRAILATGEELIRRVEEVKANHSRDFSARLANLEERVGKIKELTLTMNENDRVRECLSQAEVAFREAQMLAQQEKYGELGDRVKVIDGYLRQAENAVFSILARYADETQVLQWQRWAAETIAESRKKAAPAILVNKLERSLTLFKKGSPVAVYHIGLGKFGLSRKLHAGDEATPEGRYKIIKKNANSRYHKALLIDYPNDEDKRRYSQAKKKGQIPARAGSGGLIEIHGGGKDFLTNGCVGVENAVMDELFPEVRVGTPVTIVGSLESASKLLASLRKS
jgi:L,D-peptidoglycan transpeptidase YkuD (ErfK/YbiS/YcfS/YnhG family)